MPFHYTGDGQWSGSGDLNDPSDFLVYDSTTGQYVPTTVYPDTGAGFTGGGTLQGSGFFYGIGLAGGGYTILGNLTTNGTNGIALGFDGDPTYNYAPAELTIGAGTTVNGGYITVGWTTQGNVLVIEGGSVVSATGISVGQLSGGGGAVTIETGANVSTGNFDFGYQSAAIGSGLFDSATVTVGGFVTVGDGGSGGLTIQDSAVVSAGGFTVGASPTGSGGLTIQSGATVSASSFDFGYQSGAIGSGLFDSATVTVDFIVVGDGGSGGLTIQHEAVVSAGGVAIGNQSGGTGAITIDDATLTVSQPIVIGNAGSASLTIDDGATVTASGGITIAGQNSGVGNVVIGDAVINDGGFLTFGTGSSTIDLSGDGSINVGSGASPIGGELHIGSSGGAAALGDVTINGSVVDDGALTIGAAFDVSDGTTVNNGGQLIISAGGLTSDVTISSGGSAYVYSGGTASDVTVDSGGVLYVYSGGVDNGAIVNSGGTVVVVDGTLKGDDLDNGNINFTLTGSDTFSGTLSGNGDLNVGGSGTLVMSGGDSFSGNVRISGGTLELSSATALGTANIKFASANNPTLRIDGTVMPANIIGGYVPGDSLDFSSIRLSDLSGATLQAAGSVLQLTTSGGTYELTFTSTPPLDFALSADTSGGTVFTANNVTKVGMDEAKLILKLTKAFLQTVTALGQSWGGLTSADFRAVFTPFFSVLNKAIEGAAILNKFNDDFVAANGDPAALKTALSTALSSTVAVAIKTGLSTVLSTAAATMTAAVGDTILATVATGAVEGFLTALAVDGAVVLGVVGAPVILGVGIGVGVGLGVSFIFNKYSAPINQIIQSIISPAINAVPDTVIINLSEVGSGQSLSGVYVTANGVLNVLSGGTVSSEVINKGGIENLYGKANNTVIADGGTQFVFGVASNTVLLDPSIQIVSSGGVTNDTTIYSGEQDVYGIASGTDIENGGVQLIESGGAAVGTLIGSGGVLELASGGGIAGAIVFAGGTLKIDGTTMPSSTISGFVPGDSIDLASAAFSASGSATLGSGGVVTVVEGGNNYQINFDPNQDFSNELFAVSNDGAGGTKLFLRSLAGAPAVLSSAYTVASGQAVTDMTIVNGGDLILEGGTASDTLISSGGLESVNSGGTDVAATVSGGGQLLVYAGANASNDVVLSGAFLQLGLLSQGGVVGTAGGTANGTIISSGGFELVHSGGADFGATVNGGGNLQVFAGASETDDVVRSGGLLLVGVPGYGAGGIASDTTISSGGLEIVNSGGTDIGALVEDGGKLLVSAFGSTTSDSLIGSDTSGGGGLEVIFSGGTAISTTLSASANLVVSAGGIALHAIVDSRTGSFNGGMNVSSGGVASATVINSGGFEFVDLGGLESGATVNQGGTLVNRGGTTIAVEVEQGGVLSVSSGGVDSSANVTEGGLVVVSSGGITISALLTGNGPANRAFETLSGGTASATTIVNAGALSVRLGGLAVGTIVNSSNFNTPGSNGGLFVSSGGLATGTIVNSGGLEVVFFGGTDSGVTINGGGRDLISSGGSETSATVFAGGTLVVSSGGSATDTVINGGTEHVLSGGNATNITFSGLSGTVLLDDAAGLSGTISHWGIGDTVDFVSASIVSAAISGSHLIVTEANNQTFSYQLVNQAQGTTAKLVSDQNGGTDLILVSSTSPAVAMINSIAIAGIGITTGSGDLNAGKVVTFEVNMSEAVTVAGGSPTLNLNDGGIATFDAAHSTSSELFFDYTIAAGQNTSDLAVSSLSLHGATIQDGAGNNADLSGAINYNPAGILQIDTHTAAAPLPPLQGLTTGEQQVEAMYVAYFGRAGDSAGTYFWMGNLDAGQPVDNVASNFAPQIESEAIYPLLAFPNTDSESARVAFIDSIYQNLFNRGPDAPGLAYWDNELHNDQLTLSGAALSAAFGGFILEVIRGAQNSSAGQDITTIENKVAVASYFTEQLAVHDVNYASNLPATVDAQAHSVVAATDSTAASVSTEKAAVDADILTDSASQNGTAVSFGFTGSSPGNFTIDSQDLELFGPSIANVTFGAGSTGILKLDNSQGFSGTVAGLALGNGIDLSDLSYQGNAAPRYVANGNNTGGMLAVSEGAATINIALLGNYAASAFVASSDGHGGTFVTDPPLNMQKEIVPPHLS